MWPWSSGKGQLGIHACFGSAHILCTPSGSVSTGRLRTGASLDLHCRAKSERSPGHTHLIVNSLTVNIWHNWIPPEPERALASPRGIKGKRSYVFIYVSGSMCSFIVDSDSLHSVVMDPWPHNGPSERSCVHLLLHFRALVLSQNSDYTSSQTKQLSNTH